MKGKKMSALIADAVRTGLIRERATSNPSLHTLTIHFENKSVTIPYLPWEPKKDITLPGRWVEDE